jgi:hypothetical protein
MRQESTNTIELAPYANGKPAVNRKAVSASRPIAVLLHTFEGWGAVRDAILLCNALAAREVAVTIIVLRDEGALRSLVSPKIQVVDVSIRRARYAVPALRRAIRAIDPRVVLSSGPIPNLCCLAAIRSLPGNTRPRILLREVASPAAARDLDPCWQERVAYGILRRCYRFADRVITLTEGARHDLVQNFAIPTA